VEKEMKKEDSPLYKKILDGFPAVAENAFIPVMMDKNGPLFSSAAVHDLIKKELLSGTRLTRVIKDMNNEISEATAAAESITTMFHNVVKKLIATETEVTEAVKKNQSSLKKSANDLAEGLKRIEKIANMDLLESRVALLERAAASLTQLAALEQDGRLSKVMDAFNKNR
jgi:hypothetical protein